jgi:hypothetical protein
MVNMDKIIGLLFKNVTKVMLKKCFFSLFSTYNRLFAVNMH